MSPARGPCGAPAAAAPLRRLLLLAGALVAGGAIAACGGAAGNGVAARSPAAIVAAARRAITSVRSVHVWGSVSGSGLAITLDLDLLAGRGGQGEMTLGGRRVRVKAIGKSVYFNASSAFWTHYAGVAAAHLLHGNWLKMPATTSGFTFVAALTNLRVLFNTFLPGPAHRTLRKGSATTISGQPAIGVVDEGTQGTLYVATTGRPYPVALARATGGRILFDRYNERVALKAPSDTIDIVQLKK